MILWIVGLSGTGKSALAGEVFRMTKKKLPNMVMLDGDIVREIFGNDLGHDMESRRNNAVRLSQLSLFLYRQGIHAVGAIASAFEETREWNRSHIPGYYEVLIEAPPEQVELRDVKELYRRAQKGEILLPGINQPYEKPEKPDEVIQNDGTLEELLFHAHRLTDLLCRSETKWDSI